jgi:hypothetical protein
MYFGTWNDATVALELVEADAQMITCRVTCKITHVQVWFLFIYSLHTVVARPSLWDAVLAQAQRLYEPWNLLGDFNTYREPSEKINGAPLTAYDMQDFTDFCVKGDFADLPFSGPLFTWTYNYVWSKLDCIIGNSCWFQSSLNAMVESFPLGAFRTTRPWSLQ